MVGFTFYSENRTHLYIVAGFRERHRSLRINNYFHSCPRHHFLCKPSSLWFRNFSDVYHHIMCLGIPCFIICIFTTQSFPQGSMYVWLYMAQWLAWCSLNKYWYNEEWRNTGSLWVHQISDGEFLCIKGPYDSLLISSIAYSPMYTFYYKYMNL